VTDFIPAVAFPPGEFLAEEIGLRGWSRADFAVRTGLPVAVIVLSARALAR